MSETEARIGYGSVFEMADLATPTVFTYIAEAYNYAPPSETTDTPDATNFQSPNRTKEFVEGLTDPGESSFEMNLVPGSASDKALIAAKGKKKWCRFTWPNGVQIMYIGLRQGYERSVPNDDKMTATVTWKVSGDPIQTDPTAPRNLVAAAITGTPQVGAPLTVDPGVWAGAMEIAVQWQKDAGGDGNFADITGATGSAYVPVTADVGSKIRVTLTGSNADFDTSANSAETAAVVAAA
ncbi:phage tail tube protein [Chelativorans sp. AA-79]|uniref:phage tail tube protein n=1 Tax=Chelativorans sp. AA-79 TaxID=3028735 RepID=UPI0023F828E7|nr:phage tail tube protein [Chelativorans sp. AA-79]WEX07371.1 phage tail tube protein [Chelativorans sp. AA-79]